MKNLYLLPSPNPSRLYYFGSSPELRLTKYPNLFRVFERSTQHIYIVANGKFSRDQYVTDGIEVIKASPKLVDAQGLIDRREWKKIILTTDGVLINEGVQAIPEEFLEWFIKNPKCGAVVIIEKSRCCGRCNGVDDLCYTDMCCDDHHVYGCETCYGKRVEYSITIPTILKKVLTEEDIFNQKDIDAVTDYINKETLKQEEPKESNMTTAIRFLEWYRRKRVIFQFHCYHIPNIDDKYWEQTVFLGDNSYLNADQLFKIFEKENYETSL
jgi:hypothetical protein